MKAKRDPGLDKALLAALKEGNLGAYLKLARERAELSQGDVAKVLKLHQFQSISQWERNFSGSVPIPALKKLIDLYDLPTDEVYEILLKYQQLRLETKLKQKFYGVSGQKSGTKNR